MSRGARLAGLALFFIACAVYGSFVPLRWRPIAWMDGLHRFARMPVDPALPVFNGDFFTNVLVFLPIGFFSAGALSSRLRPVEGQVSGRPEGLRNERPPLTSRNVRGAAVTVVVGSATLSTLIELGQVYVRGRTPSWSDVVAQTLGGSAGGVLWVLVGVAAIEWLGNTMRAPSREDRLLRLLFLYATGWMVYAALPTVFPRLAHPQLHLWDTTLYRSRLALAGPLLIAALAAAPLGGLAALLTARGRFRWAAGPLAAAGIALLVLADRVRQVSFVPTDGHLAAGMVGYSCGWLLAGLGYARLDKLQPGQRRWATVVALTGWLALVVLRYWAPFDFGVSAQAFDQRIAVLYTWAPFHRYYWLPPLVALGEVMTLLLLALGTGVLLSLIGASRRHLPSARETVLVTALIFVLVEWGQLYLPLRRADPTDVLVAVTGALLGTVVARALAGSPPPVNGATTS